MFRKKQTKSSFYELKPLDKDGNPYSFEELKGKVVIIVNVASKCGHAAYNYTELEDLNRKFADQGLVILGFPCNQFLRQEPGTDEEIQEFCKATYDVTFKVLKKIMVNGLSADPVYDYLKLKKSGVLGITRVKWNFEKFVINRKGEVVARFATTRSPRAITGDIQRLLRQKV